LEEADGAMDWKSSAGAEERSLRMERILIAARTVGINAPASSSRITTSPLREDLTLQEALIARAVQFLQRRQASGAVLEHDWRVLTSKHKKFWKKAWRRVGRLCRLADELPVVAAQAAKAGCVCAPSPIAIAGGGISF